MEFDSWKPTFLRPAERKAGTELRAVQNRGSPRAADEEVMGVQNYGRPEPEASRAEGPDLMGVQNSAMTQCGAYRRSAMGGLVLTLGRI